MQLCYIFHFSGETLFITYPSTMGNNYVRQRSTEEHLWMKLFEQKTASCFHSIKINFYSSFKLCVNGLPHYICQETWVKNCLILVFGYIYNSVQNFSFKRTNIRVWRQPIYAAHCIRFTSYLPTKASTLLHWVNLSFFKKV